MNKKIIIADASPLIAFGRINQISLLTATLGQIVIPEKIADECLMDITKPGAKEINQAIEKETIKINPNPDIKHYKMLLDVLDMGEAIAIALALQLNKGLLIDEKLGRSTAKNLNIKIIGTAGVLLLAKQKKKIQKIAPFIDALKNAGYFLSKELRKEILKRAKEK